MNKTSLIIGILLLILGIIVGSICLLLPVITYNRISFNETVFGLIPAGVFFLLGLIFTILSIIFIKIARKTAERYKVLLEPEGIIFFEGNLRGSLTLRNFHRPGRYSSWEKRLITALIALTNKRLLALNGSFPIIDAQLNDERLRQIKFSLEDEDKLCLALDANLFHVDWSGEIEYRVKTPNAREYLKKINEIKGF